MESGQLLSHFTMRKVESRKCHLNVFLCAGKLKMFPQETLFKVCKPVTESVASAEKLTFFLFLWIAKVIREVKSTLGAPVKNLHV